jgi:thioredoxin 1
MIDVISLCFELAQCPCSGSGGETNGVATWIILAVLLSLWLLVRSIYDKKGASLMNKILKVVIVITLAVVVVGVFVSKKSSSAPSSQPSTKAGEALPRLVDLGSTTCIPCKMMAPILEELKKECAGMLAVEFIDITVDNAAASRYGIKLIPTQIFFDASGKEVFRHEGFFSKEDILAKWKALGVNLAAASTKPASASSAPAVKSGST